MSPIFDYLDTASRNFIIHEVKSGLFSENFNETKCILKLLISNPVAQDDRFQLVSIILNSNFEKYPKLVRYVAQILSNWHEIISLKSLIPPVLSITADLCKILAKLRVVIDCLYNLLENTSSESFTELKHLHN